MPPTLVKAHDVLDKAVDAAYGYRGGKDDAARVAFLFGLYQSMTTLQTERRPRARRKAESV
jgi:hypothetical protein